MCFYASVASQLADVFLRTARNVERERPFLYQQEQNKNANRVAERKPANASQPDAETKNQKIFDGVG